MIFYGHLDYSSYYHYYSCVMCDYARVINFRIIIIIIIIIIIWQIVLKLD